MINELNFYKEYFDGTSDDSTALKLQKLKECIQDGRIYKFIAFTDDNSLNTSKLYALENDELWFSHYIYLNDPTEFQIKYDVKKVSNKTLRDGKSMHDTISVLKEIYDICSFSYEYGVHMWENYANSGNGICLVFNVNDYDKLFPVDYIDKWKINYSKIIIDAFKRIDKGIKWGYCDPLSMLPYVTKNPINEELISSEEKEVRILYPSFDDGSCNGGYVLPNIKQKLGYRGCNVPYSFCKLDLDRVILGKKCETQIIQKIIQIAEEKNVKYEKMN